jgi:hypothetical protein
MSLFFFAAGGALVAALVRRWCAGLGWRWIGGYWLLAGAFWAAPLTTSALQVPTDIFYASLPWREMTAGAVVPANPLLDDVPRLLIPLRALVRDRLLHAEAPLWSHEIGSGQPLLGDAISAPFSPFGLLTLPMPPVRELPVMAALSLFLSLLLTHCLMLELGAGAAGCLFAALAFSFSVFSICWALHPQGMSGAWLPGLAIGMVRLRRGGRGAFAGLVTCGTGLALSGHPETMAHGALAAGLVAGGLALGAGAAPRWRFGAALAAAAALTAGLTAPVLLPVVEALPDALRTSRVAVWPASVQPPPLAAASLQVLVDPLAYGSPRDGDYSGPANYNEFCSGYAGLLALALAAAAAFALRGRVLAIFAGGAAAAGAAFGVPPLLALVRGLPLVGDAPNGRLRLLWVLAVAVAAGLGLEELAAGRAGRLTAAACTGAAALALALARPPAPPWQRAWWLAAIAGAAATAVAFAWAAARRTPAGRAAVTAVTATAAGATAPAREPPRGARLAWLAVACLGLDLGLLEARFLPVVPSTFDLAPPPAVAELQRAQRAAPGQAFRVMGSGYALAPNLASYYGLWDPRAYDPMQPARAAQVVHRIIRPDLMLRTGKDYPASGLSFLAVRYMLTPHEQHLGPPWQAAWEGRGGKLWRNPQALPLFFMPSSFRVAHSSEEALRGAPSIPDFATEALAEMAVGPRGFAGEAPLPAAASARRLQRGSVRSVRVWSNGAALEVASPTGGLIASSVSFARGWRLTLDELPSPLLRVNGGFLGFIVPAGEHRARLEYRPAGWVWGLRSCGVTLAAILAFGALPAARRRARRRRSR